MADNLSPSEAFVGCTIVLVCGVISAGALGALIGIGVMVYRWIAG